MTNRLLVRVCLSAWVGGLLVLLPTAWASDADRAPTLLHKTMLLPPMEAIGTEIMPEVRVKVALDRRGAVSSVEVLDIKPSNELDGAFERTTMAELQTWRYAPAIENGEPVEATLEWTVQFQASEVGSESSYALGSLARLESLDQELQRHDFARNLSFDRQKQLLLDYKRIAETGMDPAFRRRANTPRFLVVTDIQAENAAEIIANNLEVFLNTLSDLYQADLEPHPHRLKTLVFVYAKRESLKQVRKGIRTSGSSGAEYLGPGLITGHVEGQTSDQVISMLVHEASHAYSDHHLRAPGVSLPTWLEEGVAQYMANSEIKKRRLIPGRTLKRRFVLNHYRSGARAAATNAGWDLAHVKRAILSGNALSLAQLLESDELTFYAEESPLYYATSWLLVHFLRHGEDDWQETKFPELMLYMVEGYSSTTAIEAIYGRSIADLEVEFLDYVKLF